jgi:hypothetical protein
MGETITYFFSYVREDAAFVLKLAQELRAVGANVWVDKLDILGGQRWDVEVAKALKTCKGMIAVLSPQSVASTSVMDEVSYALEEGKLVVPVLVHPCEIPFRLRRVQYVDFTTEYENAFERLRRSLSLQQPGPDTHELPVQTTVEPPNPVPTQPQQGQGSKGDGTHPPIQISRPPIDWRQRLRGAMAGVAVGILYMWAFSLLTLHRSAEWQYVVLRTGGAGAIAGAIGAMRRVATIAAVVGTFVGFAVCATVSRGSEWGFVLAAVYGAPIGAIMGAIVGVFLLRRAEKRRL